MNKFNVGAMRPATDDARTARISAANDLVQRTLAQHGLMPEPGSTQAGLSRRPLPNVASMMARFGSSLGENAGNAIPVPDGAQFRRDEFSCAEGSRAYRTYVPSTAGKGIAGVVVMLHGCTQNPEDFAIGTGMNHLAEKYRLIVVYPQQSRGENAQSCWNWFRRGDQLRDRGEPAILAGMTRKVMAEHSVPEGQAFVAGLSAGAAMAVILGETYPDLFAAVGAHSGLPYGSAKDVASAFAAMAGAQSGVHTGTQSSAANSNTATSARTIIFHGAADSTVHPSNGDRIARDVLSRGERQTIDTEKLGEASGRSFRRKVSESMDGASRVEHWIVDGLGHAWSGGNPSGSFTDDQGPDASAEMVRFFLKL